MMDVLSLRKDSDFQTKQNILNQLQNQGYLDQMRAQLKSQVIKAMEQEKKKAYGGASKYLQQSELSNPITKKVVGHPDGLLCAEIIREFLTFYKMNLSMQVFVPEMSLGTGFPKTRGEMEREIGIGEPGDQAKPLLLKLIEQLKYGSPIPVTKQKPDNPNYWSTAFEEPQQQQAQPKFEDPFKKPIVQPIMEEPPKSDKKKKSKKKGEGKGKKAKAKKEEEPKPSVKNSNTSLTKLDDLPTLGGPKKAAIKDDYDDFGFDDDEDEGPGSGARNGGFASKYDKVKNLLDDHEQEENQGFKMKVPPKVNNQRDLDNYEDEFIDEDIQSEYDNYNGKDNRLGESSGDKGSARGFQVTVSQSLGIDKSVDSLALDDYDHIEFVE